MRDPSDPAPPDLTSTIAVAVALLALAGVAALLGDHLLLGALRILAGVLAAAGAGALVLGLASRLLAPGPARSVLPRVLAASVAVLLGLALTLPPLLASRPTPLDRLAVATLPALGETDRVVSLPIPHSPVLVLRADGTASLLRGARVDAVTAHPGDVLALSAEGSRLVRIGDGVTVVSDLPEDGAPVEAVSLPGAPLALDGNLLVLRTCADGSCWISGHDLAAGAQAPALWTTSDGAGEEPHAAPGPDPSGVPVPLDAGEPADLLEALRSTGILPAVPLRFDPDQGWLQLDPTTGFPLGNVLTDPAQDCRIAVTAAPPARSGTLPDPAPQVLTVCGDADGALTATAHREGAVLWRSDPSPAGTWTVQLGHGRVIAVGTEQGSAVAGEIVAAQDRAAWVAPGGAALRDASALTARIGIDGARMVVINDAGQLIGYDTSHGTTLWALAVQGPVDEVRGSLAAGTAVVVDEARRTAALDPREGRRLRVIDAATGEVTVEAVLARPPEASVPVGTGMALVTDGDRTHLVGS